MFHHNIPLPEQLIHKLPRTAGLANAITDHRRQIRNILRGTDRRLLVVVGPCSIHDSAAALDYARRLKDLSARVDGTLLLVMRVYLEKPRTVTGWKGLINDPGLDGSHRIGAGLKASRRLLIDIGELGLPAATEAVDPLVHPYVQDLISWTAIGARTVESQIHREMVSGLDCPVGFKNSTSGDLRGAIAAMQASMSSHRFLGIDGGGRVAVRSTRGNPHTHIVLRGGARPNYDADAVRDCERLMRESGLEPRLMVDCSHGNSQRQPERQAVVLDDAVSQIERGNRSIRAVMIESNLRAGSQPLTGDPAALEYGVSITDKCLDWETTARILLQARDRLRHTLSLADVAA